MRVLCGPQLVASAQVSSSKRRAKAARSKARKEAWCYRKCSSAQYSHLLALQAPDAPQREAAAAALASGGAGGAADASDTDGSDSEARES